jgi:hypothetical protein
VSRQPKLSAGLARPERHAQRVEHQVGAHVTGELAADHPARVDIEQTVLIIEENTTFGMSRQRRANSTSARVAPGCLSAVGQ